MRISLPLEKMVSARLYIQQDSLNDRNKASVISAKPNLASKHYYNVFNFLIYDSTTVNF